MKEHICYNCDEEFTVKSVYETESEVSFCPYCGSELDFEEDDEDDELDDEDYRD